ncbi:MAG: hypothetical protein V3T39_09210 [Gammaproteobacteria bacterium]
MSNPRRIRITVLLLVLAGVAFDAWYTNRRMTDWKEPLWLAVFPVYGDSSPATARYLEKLSASDFSPLEEFLKTEVAKYRGDLDQPVVVKLAPPEKTPPPSPPRGGGIIDTALWSLSLRSWADEAETRLGGPPPDIRLFVIYHDPQLAPAVPHSLGLQKGLVGVVHAFADDRMRGSNLVIVMHEMLHTLGATDKYDPANNLPIWPDGYAKPGAAPLFPQSKAEIMAGRIPVTANIAEVPGALHETIIGPLTAREINLQQ